jgi:hypothetical protein
MYWFLPLVIFTPSAVTPGFPSPSSSPLLALRSLAMKAPVGVQLLAQAAGHAAMLVRKELVGAKPMPLTDADVETIAPGFKPVLDPLIGEVLVILSHNESGSEMERYPVLPDVTPTIALAAGSNATGGSVIAHVLAVPVNAPASVVVISLERVTRRMLPVPAVVTLTPELMVAGQDTGIVMSEAT